MKNISLWAKKNRTKTIFLLIFIHILLGYFYFYTGVLFYLEEIKTPSILVPIASGIFILATFFYPVEDCQQGIYKNTFFRRKFWQSLAMLSAALFFIHAGNHLSRSAMANEVIEFSSENIVLDSRKLNQTNKKNARSLKRSLRKKFRKRLRSRIKEFRQFRKRSEQGKNILYFVLVIIGALVLTFLLLGLSCSISCSGSETFALIVFLGGLTLIIYGVVVMYRRLFKDKKRKVKPKPVDG